MEKQVLQFSLKMGTRTYNVDLASELKIDKANIDEEMTEQPMKYAWYSAIFEEANNEFNRCKLEVAELEAGIVTVLRERAKTGERLTEKVMDSEMRQFPSWSTLQRKMLDAQSNLAMARVAKEAFQQRRDMIVSLGSLLREERMWSSDARTLKTKTLSGVD